MTYFVKCIGVVCLLLVLVVGGGISHGDTSHHGPADHDSSARDLSPPGQEGMAHESAAHSQMDHGGMDHGKMDSNKMDHGEMNYGDMDHGTEKAAASMDHSPEAHARMIMEANTEDAAAVNMVKVDEQLGKMADLSARFKDEDGNPVVLEQIFDRPVVVLPVYFLCTSICNFLQAELANALNQVNQLPGEDFNIIHLSFSDEEDPTLAKASKRNYANLLKRKIPLENWYYLTGDRENILKFTDSVGYYFMKKKPHFYIHPNALIVLGSDGKIIRYLYGPNFLPFDLGMAVNEAEKGTPGISIKRGVLSFCFDYDPENKTYVFKMFRVTGTAILVLLAGFVYFLIRPSRKKPRETQPPPES